ANLDGEGICEEGTHLKKVDWTSNNSGKNRGRPPMAAWAPAKESPPRHPGSAKRVALVGSSGGGAAAQGQFDGLSLLLLVEKELSRAGLELSAVQFVACVEPLDSAAPSAAATLWVMRGDQGLAIAAQGTISEVNLAAREEDAKIAAALRKGGR
ncbi:unnamed protein product, partial [Laminaria digitata]